MRFRSLTPAIGTFEDRTRAAETVEELKAALLRIQGVDQTLDETTRMLWQTMSDRLTGLEVHMWALQAQLFVMLTAGAGFLARPWARRLWNGRDGHSGDR